MKTYYRPLVQTGATRPTGALALASGALWFDAAIELSRDAEPRVVPAHELPAGWQTRLTAPRGTAAGLDLSHPRLMGILNVTPDSFSDGGVHDTVDTACAAAVQMTDHGADIIDIGGESTRPGAQLVGAEEEINRVVPAITALRKRSRVAISVDTRKAAVARSALAAGADLVNDVSGLTYDTTMAPLCAGQGVPVCVMHAQGDPETMQNNPRYDNVVLDVYDFLSAQVDRLCGIGIKRQQILVDPGIGFGKSQAHNLALLQNISIFHGLGCAILLGASRKRFIGDIGNAPVAQDRAAGSIAVGLAGLAQGVQVLRVHDVAETAQAIRLWQAVR